MNGKILIIDDVATNRIVLKVKLGEARYHPLMAATGAEGLRMARKEHPDLILLDLMLPDISGVDVLQRLRNDPVTRDIPVIVVSTSTSLADRIRALEAGADDVFVKPFDDHLLMARLRNLLRSRQDLADLTEGQDPALFGMAEQGMDFAHPGVLALVTDRPEMAIRLRHDLAPMMRDKIIVLGFGDVLADPEPGRTGADIYVIDADVPHSQNALRLLSDLRSRAPTRHAGICLLTGPFLRQDTLMGFDLGADAILSAGQSVAEIAGRLRAVLRRKRRADQRRERVQDGLRLAMIDPLTGLFNRRYAAARLGALVTSAVETGQSMAVMVVDIDRFKSVNDRFGHAVGDDVLVQVCQRLAANLRADDLLARVGGEEFLIALPDTQLEEAHLVARRLCRMVQERPLGLPQGESLTITISIGLTLLDGVPRALQTNPADVVGALIDRADQALMESKKAGRNTVTLRQTAA